MFVPTIQLHSINLLYSLSLLRTPRATGLHSMASWYWSTVNRSRADYDGCSQCTLLAWKGILKSLYFPWAQHFLCGEGVLRLYRRYCLNAKKCRRAGTQSWVLRKCLSLSWETTLDPERVKIKMIKTERGKFPPKKGEDMERKH